MTPLRKLALLSPLIVALSPVAGANSVSKAPICARAIRELLSVSEGECMREKATFLVVDRSDAGQEVELFSLEPTQSFKAWAKCIGENWCRIEAGKSSQANVGTKVVVDLVLGECGSELKLQSTMCSTSKPIKHPKEVA